MILNNIVLKNFPVMQKSSFYVLGEERNTHLMPRVSICNLLMPAHTVPVTANDLYIDLFIPQGLRRLVHPRSAKR